MAATFPAGLLEKMISLTESLLASLGNENVSATSPAAFSYRSKDGENSILYEDGSGKREVPAVSMVLTSLAPVDIISYDSLKLSSCSQSDVQAESMVLTSQVPADLCSNSASSLRRKSSDSCSADIAAQSRTHGGGVSFRDIKGSAKKSLIELDTISRHILRQVIEKSSNLIQ
jgi:hypothetical protein